MLRCTPFLAQEVGMKTFTSPTLAKLLILVSFLDYSLLASANSSVSDYQLQSTIYHWYGLLDKPELNLPAAVKLDLGEYKGNQRVAGAHHILSLTPISHMNGKTKVKIELEFLPKLTDTSEVIGQYVIQQLTIDTTNKQILSSETKVNEVDDFSSNYREAGDFNLIKSFVYGWTHTLDKLSEGKTVSTEVVKKFTSQVEFTAEEAAAETPAQYIKLVKTQNYQQSRRAVKNLNIRKQKQSDQYRISYQYVWNATNHDNENELAQVGVELTISIVNGEVQILRYQAEYLPPVTDLGAEIRC